MTMPPSAAQASRIRHFVGGLNFRDLGGYRTRDSREIKWGRVFRTGVLSYFTPNDQQQLSRFGVRAIFDLRLAAEREREPTRWPDANTKHFACDDGSPPVIGLIAANHPYTEAGMHAAMIEYYRALPAWIAPRLRIMFERIAKGDVPMLVHCHAGKDRTGIAIALLLTVLDVQHETIVDDYLLTNDACDIVQFIVRQHEAKAGATARTHPLLTTPKDICRAIFTAQADYLHAALDQIARDHGDVSRYLHNELGVDDALRAKVQAALLSDG